MDGMILTVGLICFFIAFGAAVLLAGSLVQAGERLGAIALVGGALKKALPPGIRHRYDRMLLLAGSPRDMSVETLLGIKVLAIPAALILMMMAAAILAQPVLFSLPVLALVIVAGSFTPDLWLSHISTDRQKRIRRDLPDTLDLLTINVEAGLGFDAAISRLVGNLHGPLIEEFSRMLREMQLGRSRGEALRALMERTNVSELNSFVLAIIEADIFGISIGATLRSQSRDMRSRRRSNAEQMAMKTPVKIIFPLVLFIFPALLIIIVGPAGIRIATVLGDL
ncbi:MAG: type II secretion system F family protein [Actinomycetota bacterium]|nr:type II secretion system F family protein [Actinomycetota bacterium]